MAGKRHGLGSHHKRLILFAQFQIFLKVLYRLNVGPVQLSFETTLIIAAHKFASTPNELVSVVALGSQRRYPA